MRLELLSGLFALGLLALVLRRADWRPFADREGWLVFLAATLAFALLRSVHVATAPGLDLHFLGAAIATLMFGWRFALLAQALAVVLAAAIRSEWNGLALQFLLGAGVPIALVWGALALSRTLFGRNPFGYVFGAAFAGGALAVAAAQLGQATFAAIFALGHPQRLAENYLLTLPAMMFGEAFLSGGTLAILISYRPDWVATFDDRFYLGRNRDQRPP
jgi:uncharacterized membrane protein